jgi:uncharacterized membrane protein YfcA
MDSLVGVAGLFLAGIIAGAINSMAGGGTLISFPALVAFGIPPIPANATNTAAVCPGALSSAFACRRDLAGQNMLLWRLLLPSLAGGLLGAVILAITPARAFALIVTFLVPDHRQKSRERIWECGEMPCTLHASVFCQRFTGKDRGKNNNRGEM